MRHKAEIKKAIGIYIDCAANFYEVGAIDDAEDCKSKIEALKWVLEEESEEENEGN